MSAASSRSPLAPGGLVLPDDLNALAPAVWPMHAERRSGELTIGGVGAAALAERFGTPLYVLDEADVRSRAARTRDAFNRAFEPLGVRVKVYYAAKAFLSIEVARWMDELGLALDVASGGEFAVGIAAGFPASR
ncbi:MAG: diaminopimelate decarboxylase, partial [Naasia sp.]